MAVEVRAAAPGEEEAIVPLYEWLFAPPGSRPPTWDERRAAVALGHAIASHDAVVLLAADDTDVPPASSQGAPASGDPGFAGIRPGAAGSGGGLIGLCTAYQDLHSVRFGYRAWVEDLAVHPEHRSRGVGKALLEAAKDWARERGATHLELDSSEARLDAHRFYERELPSWRSVCFGWEL